MEKWKDLRQRIQKFHDECCIFNGFRKDGDDQQFVKWYLKYSNQFIGGIIANSIEELELKLTLRGY